MVLLNMLVATSYNDVMNEDGVIEHVGSNKLIHQFEAEIKFNF